MTISVNIKTDGWPPAGEYDDEAFLEADQAAADAIAALVEAGGDVGNVQHAVETGLSDAGVE